jgi:hypothetical protein
MSVILGPSPSTDTRLPPSLPASHGTISDVWYAEVDPWGPTTLAPQVSRTRHPSHPRGTFSQAQVNFSNDTSELIVSALSPTQRGTHNQEQRLQLARSSTTPSSHTSYRPPPSSTIPVSPPPIPEPTSIAPDATSAAPLHRTQSIPHPSNVRDRHRDRHPAPFAPRLNLLPAPGM